MTININNCDFRNDYFHFSNKANASSILKDGLLPAVGPASQLVGHAQNVSVSQGAKGIMGIINSFLYVFSTKVKVSEIPEDYKKYFLDLDNFQSDCLIPKDIVCNAMRRKLQDEIYFRVELDDEQLEKAKIGGFTGFDIKLPMAIDPTKLSIVSDDENKVLTAYDVASYVYEKSKHIDVFRIMHDDFFYMFEGRQQNTEINDLINVVGKRR